MLCITLMAPAKRLARSGLDASVWKYGTLVPSARLCPVWFGRERPGHLAEASITWGAAGQISSHEEPTQSMRAGEVASMDEMAECPM